MRTQGMKYTDTVMTTYETCWLATGNSWLSLVSREAADIKRLIFAWSSIQKKKVVTATIAYCRLVFTSHKLEINVPWLAAESVCVVCAVVMCGAKIFFVWIIVERRMKLISQILVLFTIPVYLVIQVNIRMKTISKIRPFF